MDASIEVSKPRVRNESKGPFRGLRCDRCPLRVPCSIVQSEGSPTELRLSIPVGTRKLVNYACVR